MRSEYALIMSDVLLHLSKRNLNYLTLDGTTNVQGKQSINMITCMLKAFFLEDFTMNLQRESAKKLLKSYLTANCIF